MLALGIGELPFITGTDGGSELLGGERPAAVLATIHALDGQAGFVAGEIEGVQTVDQEHVAGCEGGGERGHGNTDLK
jgi:hypothetical protein